MTIHLPRALLAALLLAVIAAAIAGAYVVGRNSVNQQSVRRTAYASGYHDGRAAASAKTNAAIYRAVTRGQNLAFQGFNGGWVVGNWYVVKIGSGSDRRHGPVQHFPPAMSR